MKIDARIRELTDRHRRLEAELRAEQTHPSGDDGRMLELKRRKLRIKDEIAGLRAG
jgi:hypothetical protein